MERRQECGESEAATRPGSVLQVVAILCAMAYFSVLLHKAWSDLSRLAIKYPGEDFWRALGRYLLANLAA